VFAAGHVKRDLDLWRALTRLPRLEVKGAVHVRFEGLVNRPEQPELPNRLPSELAVSRLKRNAPVGGVIRTLGRAMLDLDLDVIGHNPLHVRDIAIAIGCVKEHGLDVEHGRWRDVLGYDLEVLDLILLRTKRYWDASLECFQVVQLGEPLHLNRLKRCLSSRLISSMS
jgi:hypothetical protein